MADISLCRKFILVVELWFNHHNNRNGVAKYMKILTKMVESPASDCATLLKNSSNANLLYINKVMLTYICQVCQPHANLHLICAIYPLQVTVLRC